MPSDVPSPAERTSSTPSQDITPKSNKRSHQPSQSSQSPGRQPSDEPPRDRETLIQPQGLRASSRDTAEMHRSATPPEASSSRKIKYTATGRVSKAAKGQRVHHCEECGKTYTRAEHLRRHQQNHKPGAFPCDWPHCGRSFYREDLLVRHKSRHNDPLNPPSRRQSVGSQSSSADFSRLVPGSSQASDSLRTTAEFSIVTTELQQETSSRAPQQANTASRTPKRVPVPPNELPLGVPLMTDGPIRFENFTNPWDLSPPLSPSTHNMYDYESTDENPDALFYQPQTARARNHSDTPLVGYDQSYSTSRSPISVRSSTQLHRWSFQLSCDAQYLTGPGSFGGGLGYSTPEYVTELAYSGSQSTVAEARDLMEHGELAMLDVIPGSFQVDDNLTAFSLHQHYLEGFWAQVHELFPIVHKPTFDYETASPLLRASMLALGGQASGDRTDLANARIIHERSLKVLKRRTISHTHTYRICDMQAIVLVEVYSLFKSRRPPLTLSKHFETVYGLLSRDSVAFVSSGSTAGLDSNSFNDDEVLLNTACKERLLLACYVLEQQHSTLFGRQPTACFNRNGVSLPYPTSQVEWDAVAGTASSGHYERTSQALHDLQFMLDPVGAHMDSFRSMLLMACRFDAPKDLTAWADGCEDFPITLAAEKTPRTRLAYHTFMLCNNTPIRDLLAVAGESWILAEKLASPADYTAAQIETRQWAARTFGHGTQQPPIQEALSHAFSILSLHRKTPQTGLLFQQWAIYLAALVTWARVYAANTKEPRLSVPNPIVPQTSAAELDASVASLVLRASTHGTEWKDARSVLMWTKSKIEKYDLPHNCGLNSGAVDVLGKVIARGSEDGWF